MCAGHTLTGKLFQESSPGYRVQSNGVRVKAALGELEKALGYGFQSRELLVRALTHRSLAKEQAPENGEKTAAGAQDNERLEFLGDAVLGLVVAEALFESHPEWHEGELTRVRSRLVSRQHMAEVARAVELGGHLRLSRGEERNGLRNKGTVLSNGMEAVLGAMFLDGGLEPVRAFAGRWVMGEEVLRLAEELRSGAALGNHKSALQEYLQAERAGSPVYRVKSESGPDHRKRFVVEVRLRTSEAEPGKTLARGTGSTKKIAEQDAARRAMERLRAAAANGVTGAEPDETQGAEDGARDEEQAAE
jgi:ribonuclease-3